MSKSQPTVPMLAMQTSLLQVAALTLSLSLKHMTMRPMLSMLPSTTPAMVKSMQVMPWKQQQQLAITTLTAQTPQA
jgi:hypothetical protein